MDKTLEALTRAYQEVTEGKFIIPEEIPANERTAFHGAAAAAAKAGKSHFTFGGKKHPVTMKKDTAKAIADKTECPQCKGKGCDHCDGKGFHEDVDVEMQKDDVVLKAKKKKKGEDDPTQNNGETAVMNPKSENKATAESVKSADKKPEKYVGPDGKTHVRMVPVDKEVVKKESTDMSIRDKLLAVLEEKHSPNHDKAEKPEDAYKGAGAKQMRDDNKDTGEYHDLEKKSHDDASKAGRVTKASAPNPTDKDTKGDKNVINPVKDTTKAGKGSAEVKESFTKQVHSIAAAYQSMYEMDEGACVREMKKLHAANCSKNEVYTKCNEKYGCSKEQFESLYAQYCK